MKMVKLNKAFISFSKQRYISQIGWMLIVIHIIAWSALWCAIEWVVGAIHKLLNMMRVK